ncbi:maleylpyruvate isomerase family mycothiol-dependent enzyme [Streptomyces tsukubensis]|uniref:Maleylpyruvate isomerase family mycothiol-dependent enzyme n=1 Tax=Streptomyces tsukubensis TaxID=83656 RepID=A0A1V3ZZ57_9ACTN|nr:maleylpyruvate isomerase family mycothiol-dependent enzyme [Streptomyces tsukubensis]OON71765.1 hypothetical protein B1H18_32300 [Streptomyces tsukubensis]QFR97049.1 maleylpyruvate isomerase family mycothiol-dependent enzyme [Streptomyces tsukubensis]
MEIADHLHLLDEEGRSLARAAEDVGMDAAVPTCPGWQVEDLLLHTGVVHRWAAGIVARGHRSPQRLSAPPEVTEKQLVSWYRESHGLLLSALKDAPADLECWAFLPAPSALAFWTRRQAHETTVHRVDAEAARGGERTGITEVAAVDGIDELLLGFHARDRSRVRTDVPRVLRVRATDTGDVWTVRLSGEAPVTERGRGSGGAHDCELSGPADRLYLALWNRIPVPHITGDTALADLWRESSAIG